MKEATLTIEKNGWGQCTGQGYCGTTSFTNVADFKRSFGCATCRSRIVKIIDERGELKLNRWL